MAVFIVSSVQADKYYVTPDAPGGGTGASWDSPMTIEEVVGKIHHNDVVLCKAGVYTPAAKLILGYPITLTGGLAGTDDETLDPNGERTVIDGQDTLSTIFQINSGGSTVFERIEIQNAVLRGVDKSNSGSILFKDCVFDSCGRNYTSKIDNERGGAGRFYGKSTATIAFENCVFSRNMYEPNINSQTGYGFAVGFRDCQRVIIDNSLFISNGVGKASLKSTGGKGINNTRGAAIYSESPLTVRNTEFRANTAGISAAYGGVVYIKECGDDSAFTNCLFLANSCEYCNTSATSGNNGVLVFRADSSETLDVVNCTFAYNFTDGVKTSAGIDVGNGTANIRNSVFYGGQKTKDTASKDIYLTSSSATANVDYCLFEENSVDCFAGAGRLNIGANNVFGDPKFARAVSSDEIASVMIKSESYSGYSADAYETVFSLADVHALSRRLTVDTGDPSSPYDNEPKPNGRRVNLGYYGNTAEALSTVLGLRFIVR